MTRPRRVVIVGGGITGLAAAFHLQTSGVPLKLTVLEKADRLGGCIFTERSSGFVMEHGADVFLARKPHAVALCEALSLQAQVPLQRRAYLRRADGLYSLPEGFSGLVPARMGPVLSTRLLSLSGRARLLLEYLVPPRSSAEEESVQAFFTRRYGREAYTRIIAPLLGGLSGGDPATLSVDALLPHLRAMEQAHGSLLRATARGPRPRVSALRSLAGGLGTLIESLRLRLSTTAIRTRVSVHAISREGAQYAVHANGGVTWKAEGVLIAAPAFAAAEMLAPLNPGLSEELGTIRYGATIAVQLAFRESQVPRRLDASGYLSALGADRMAVASTWSSAKLAERAPEDHVLVRVVLGRKGDDAVFALDDARLLALAQAEVKEILGVKASPILQRVHRWHKSLPQYDMGHRKRCSRIGAMSNEHSGLHLAGAAYRGAGIPDCIRDAQRAAEAILSDLELSDA